MLFLKILFLCTLYLSALLKTNVKECDGTHSEYCARRVPTLRKSAAHRIKKRTPKLKKSTFIKIAVSFPSLILCLSSPTDDRENSDSTPRLQKVTFVKIGFPKRLPPFLKKSPLFRKRLTILLRQLTLCFSFAFLSISQSPLCLLILNHIRVFQPSKP